MFCIHLYILNKNNFLTSQGQHIFLTFSFVQLFEQKRNILLSRKTHQSLLTVSNFFAILSQTKTYIWCRPLVEFEFKRVFGGDENVSLTSTMKTSVFDVNGQRQCLENLRLVGIYARRKPQSGRRRPVERVSLVDGRPRTSTVDGQFY